MSNISNFFPSRFTQNLINLGIQIILPNSSKLKSNYLLESVSRLQFKLFLEYLFPLLFPSHTSYPAFAN